MQLSTSTLFSKRTFGVFYLCFMTLLAHIIVKHVLNLFVVFCVVYTSMDVYKKRKQYVWIIRLINGNVKFILYSVIGEDRVKDLFFMNTKKIKKSRKIDSVRS